jgi:hypothetical protein
LRRRAARLYSVDIVPPSFHGAVRCSSSAPRAMLKISGDRMPPYEQYRVMRSAGLLDLVTGMPGIEHCA